MNIKKPLLTIGLLAGMTLSQTAEARVIFQSEFIIESDKANSFILDANDDISGDIILQFGNALGETIHFDIANDRFETSDGAGIFGSTLIENIEAVESFRVNDEVGDSTPFLIDQDGDVGIQNPTPTAPLDIETSGEVLELGDGTANNILLTFDDGTDRFFGWDDPGTQFNMSEALSVNGNLDVKGDLDLNLNQALNFRLENLGAAPACNGGSRGLVYQNTTDNNTYACDGTAFQILNNVTSGGSTHYHNGTLTNDIITITRNDVTTTGENTTVYLTDDGTPGGNLLLSALYHVSAAPPAIESVAAAPAMHGYSYVPATGALTIKFLESAGVLLGGQGLEAEESGTSFTLFAIGI